MALVAACVVNSMRVDSPLLLSFNAFARTVQSLPRLYIPLPMPASMASVTRSPSAAAMGVATLSGSMPRLGLKITISDMSVLSEKMRETEREMRETERESGRRRRDVGGGREEDTPGRRIREREMEKRRKGEKGRVEEGKREGGETGRGEDE